MSRDHPVNAHPIDPLQPQYSTEPIQSQSLSLNLHILHIIVITKAVYSIFYPTHWNPMSLNTLHTTNFYDAE